MLAVFFLAALIVLYVAFARTSPAND